MHIKCKRPAEHIKVALSRFPQTVDPYVVLIGFDRACQLVLELLQFACVDDALEDRLLDALSICFARFCHVTQPLSTLSRFSGYVIADKYFHTALYR